MAEADRRKPIEWYIDQQVFIDSVEGRETVQELSALTEVDSFEQRGEELCLEGHILFTAFLGLRESETDDTGAIRQAQYRMPFDLAVPVSAQVPGTLNVTVEIPEATLDVLGPGWTHIRAVMKVDGLAGEGGYTVRCGAQEAAVGAVSASAQVDEGETEIGSPASAAVEQKDPHALADSSHGSGEALNETTTEPAFATRREREESSSGHNWKMQLEEADRALSGGFSPFKTGQSPTEAEVADTADARQDTAPIASFHYEGLDLNTPFATPANEEPEQEERREWDDTLFAAGLGDFPPSAGIAQPIEHEEDAAVSAREDSPASLESSPLESSAPERPTMAESQGVQTSYSAVPESPVQMSAAQWFWKTLNVPEGGTVATMKFRIVQEDETLDGIAQMYRLSITELLRANRRTAETTVAAGDLLYIPVRT